MQDAIVKAYALISSLRKNIDQPSITENGSIDTSYITTYHNALGLLEKQGFSISDFKIPDSEIKPKVMGFFTLNGSETRYSKERFVRKSYFLSKLDGILLYFEIQSSEPKKGMGFTLPEKH
jgi:hypothetical protein